MKDTSVLCDVRKLCHCNSREIFDKLYIIRGTCCLNKHRFTARPKHNHSPRQPARCEPPWYMDLCTFFIVHPCTYISEERSCIYPTKPFQFSHRTACQHSPLLNSQPSTALPNPHITYPFYPLASLLSPPPTPHPLS